MGGGGCVKRVVAPAAAGGVGVLVALVVGADQGGVVLAVADVDGGGGQLDDGAVSLGIHQHQIVRGLYRSFAEQVDGFVNGSALFEHGSIEKCVGHCLGEAGGAGDFHVGQG